MVLVDSIGIKPGGREDRDIPDIFGLPLEAVQDLIWHDPANAINPAGLDDSQLEEMAGNRTALAFYTWSPYMHNPKLPYRLHRTGLPTRLIWGESDGLVTPTYGRALCAMIPGAEMVTIAEAGHLPQLEQPDAFVGAVLDFAG
jgi:pimeloyl-ACP methyl ester carboxylesterase